MKTLLKRVLSAMLCLWLLPFHAYGVQELAPVGLVVGLELRDGSVAVASFDEELGAQCKRAGMQIGDVIKSIDGIAIRTADDVRKAMAQSDGTVDIQVDRNGKSETVRVTPQITSEGPKLGLYLRQGVTGIGTVTWYDADTGKFGTLGHGVNNSGGKLLQMTDGNAYDARVITVRKGKAGAPGQLMGAVERREPVGELKKNTAQGVFGVSEDGWDAEAIPVADASEIKTGKATILSTVSGGTPQEYSVEILKIYP